MVHMVNLSCLDPWEPSQKLWFFMKSLHLENHLIWCTQIPTSTGFTCSTCFSKMVATTHTVSNFIPAALRAGLDKQRNTTCLTMTLFIGSTGMLGINMPRWQEYIENSKQTTCIWKARHMWIEPVFLCVLRISLFGTKTS